MDKRMFKKEGEELQQFLAFRRKGGRVEAKKGKGSYKRHQKHKGKHGRGTVNRYQTAAFASDLRTSDKAWQQHEQHGCAGKKFFNDSHLLRVLQNTPILKKTCFF